MNSEPDVFDSRLIWPATMCVYGTSLSGKTSLVLDLIANRDKVFKVKVNKVFYIYTSMQKVFEEFVKVHPDVTFTTDQNDIPSNPEEPLLIIYDDKMIQFQSSDNTYISDVFIQKNHHSGVFTILILQSLFPKNLKCVTSNSTYHIVFPNFRDKSALSHLARQVCPGQPQFLHEAMKDCCATQKFGYLLLDCSSSQHDKFRCRNFIYPTISSKIYVPKDGADTRK